MKFIGDHLNCQTLILMYESPHTVDVYVRPQAGGSFSSVSRPFEKSLCHGNTTARDEELLPNAI
jgi:hypothetical protein